MKEESVSLFYKEGSSDKVYNVSLSNVSPKKDHDKWEVKFSYGRRGNALNAGSKTPKPVMYAQAKAIYDKLVKEKMQKGYVPDKTGTPFLSTVEDKRSVGWIPQLLNELVSEEVEAYLSNPEFCMQEKFDGRNRLLLREKTGPTGANRKGLAVAVHEHILMEMSVFSMNDVVAGEDLGDTIPCFDLISEKNLGYKDRLTKLNKILDDPYLKYLKPVYTAWTEKEKRALYKKLKDANAEGVVFKNIIAHYTPGRPASGGAQLKFKFVSDCSAMAGDTNKGKRSVELWMWKDSGLKDRVNVGNVTIYPNQVIPKRGEILSIKYLYAYPGGSLFQPVYLGPREDQDESDCVITQLKYKASSVDDIV